MTKERYVMDDAISEAAAARHAPRSKHRKHRGNDRRYNPSGRFEKIEKRLHDLEAINALTRGVSRPPTKQRQAIDFIVANLPALEKLIQTRD